MVFSSNTFLFLFLPVVLLAYFNPFFKSRSFKNLVLLLSSIGFYAWGEPLFVFLMLFTALLNWLLAWRMCHSSGHKRLWAAAAIIWDIGLLGIFKYLTFITQNIALLTGNDALIIRISLPIGISFFTFQMMSYIFDVINNPALVQKNPLHVLLYITLFPQMIAGPIVRYETVAEEITGRNELPEEFTQGILRFVYGLGKKVLISNLLGAAADIAFASDDLSVAAAWMGAICYTLQIYFDFSGYSDMAIGLGRVFGFHFLENFNYPYIAYSVTDFWRRWHISLSTWFRDYVYIPLGGNRRGTLRWIRNLFLVWLLTGIWHGANWTFILWGLYYFCLLLIEKLTLTARRSIPSLLSHGYTLLLVIVGWVLFRADTLSSALNYLGAMFGIRCSGLTDELFFHLLSNCRIILPAAILLCMPIYPGIRRKLVGTSGIIFDSAAAMIIFFLSVISCTASTYNPFIYFNF